MIFVPQALAPSNGFDRTVGLQFPRDARLLRKLSLIELQVWYASQDPQKLIEANSDFHAFWFRHYILPLKLKRFVFWFKFW